MYDYMKALQKRFDRQEYPELAAQIEYAQKELRRGMDAAERKNCCGCWTRKTRCWLNPS